MTMPVAPASPMTKRARIRASIERAKAQSDAGEREGGRAEEQRPAPADPVGDRPADELADRQARQEERERQLHRPAPGLRSRSIRGKAGRYMSMPSGPKASSRPSRRMKRRPGPDCVRPGA